MLDTISVTFSKTEPVENAKTGKNRYPAYEGISFDEGLELLRAGKVHDINVYRPTDAKDKEWVSAVNSLMEVLKVSNAIWQKEHRGDTVRSEPDASDRVWFPVKSIFTSFKVPVKA